MNVDSLYSHLPVFLQNLACSGEGWRIQHSRFGPRFEQELANAQARMTWSKDRLLEYRNERLRALLQYWDATVPYCRRLFRDTGVDPKRVRGVEDLAPLPIIDKDTIREQGVEALSTDVTPRQRVMAHTSGTTGGGLRFATTLQAQQEQWAIWWRYRQWHGLKRGTWCGYFGGRSIVPLAQQKPPFWRLNAPGRQILFSGYHMGPRHLPDYVAELRRRRPPWLHGYPSLLSLLAAHLVESSTDLGYQVAAVTTGAENLLPQQAAIMERAFGVRPRQHYGMAEAVANISECERGALHVDEDFAIVEFLPQPDGTGFRVVGTALSNRATAFLRYDTRDVVTLRDSSCPCGRAGRIVERIDGRCEDYVLLANGTRVGRMDHVFKDLVHIREAQILQDRPGAMTICVVRGREYSESDENRLLREARQRLGDDMEISIRYTDALPRSRTGKLRLVVSTIAAGQNLASKGVSP